MRIRHNRQSKEFIAEYTEPAMITSLLESAKLGLSPVEGAEGVLKVLMEIPGRAPIWGFFPAVKDVVESGALEVAYRVLQVAVAPWMRPGPYTFFGVDGRAGLTRFLRPWRLKLVSPPETDRAFSSYYYYLLEILEGGYIDRSIIKDFLNEVGVVNVHVVERAGYRRLFVELWNGVRVPLELSPSGVREAVLSVMALATTSRQPSVIVIEEPEAHLHPAAVTALARVLARSVKKLGKLVLISTHSDLLVAKLSNLVEASSLSAEVQRTLSLEDALDPGMVAVYLVRQDSEKKRAVVERVEVTETGIADTELTRIAVELANESSFISLARGEHRG